MLLDRDGHDLCEVKVVNTYMNEQRGPCGVIQAWNGWINKIAQGDRNIFSQFAHNSQTTRRIDMKEQDRGKEMVLERERGKFLTKDFEKDVSLMIGKCLYARGKSV